MGRCCTLLVNQKQGDFSLKNDPRIELSMNRKINMSYGKILRQSSLPFILYCPFSSLPSLSFPSYIFAFCLVEPETELLGTTIVTQTRCHHHSLLYLCQHNDARYPHDHLPFYWSSFCSLPSLSFFLFLLSFFHSVFSLFSTQNQQQQ